MHGVASSGSAAEANKHRRPASVVVFPDEDPTANWSETRRAVLSVLRERPRGTTEGGVAVLAELSERRARWELEALAEMDFARCATETVPWGCDLVEVLLWHIKLTEPCVKALPFLPRRPQPDEASWPSKVPAEFWAMFWAGSRGSDAVLPRDSFHVACTLLDCPDRAAQSWALRRLPLETLERCRRLRGFDEGETASALDAAIAERRRATRV